MGKFDLHPILALIFTLRNLSGVQIDIIVLRFTRIIVSFIKV